MAARAKKTARKKKSKKTTGRKVARKAAVKKKPAKKVAKKATKKKVAARKTSKKTTRKKAAAKKTTKKMVAARKSTKKKVAAKKKAGKKVARKAAGKPARRTAAKPGKKKTVKTTTTTAQATDSLVHGIAPYREKKGEEYMGDAQIEHFRAILQAWREQLVDEINRTIHTMQDETINHPDPNDRATQETDMSIELRSRDRERKLIKKIDDTLDLIDSDEYGYCEKCGVEIGIARLEARPTATLCIDCKTLDEIREKQMV